MIQMENHEQGRGSLHELLKNIDHLLKQGITPEEKRLLSGYLESAIYRDNEDKVFFEHSHGLMCTHDLQGNILRVNIAGAKTLGFTPTQLVGVNFRQLIAPEFRSTFGAYLEEIIIEGKSTGVMKTVHKDGSARIWLYHNRLERKADGTAYILGNATDITAQHLLERELKYTNEMLQRTNRVAGVGGWELNLITKSVFWTDVTKAIHEADAGFTPDLDNAINFYTAGDARERMTAAVSNAIQYGKGFELELTIKTAKDKIKWVRAIAFPEFEHGICKRLYGTLQDIDEFKKKEQEIMVSRTFLNAVLDAASEVSVVAAGINGLITVFNRGAEKMLGYGASEMVGKNTPHIFHDPGEISLRAAELSALYGESVDPLDAFIFVARKKGSDLKEWTYIRKDGSNLPVSLVVTPIVDPVGGITGYLGVATDITVQKQMETDLQNANSVLLEFVENTPAAVAMFDTDIRYIAYSKRWMEEYKLTDQTITGRSHYEVFPNITQEWKDIHQRCLAGKVEHADEDVWRPAGWEQDQYLRWEVRPWYRQDGSTGGIMMLTQDITELCLQREALRLANITAQQAKMVAEQASLAKSAFLANMSHEIRTPLNAVIGFTDLVLKTSLSPTQQQYLSIVSQSGTNLLEIISDILDFSKIEAGKLELDIDKCDLFEIADQALDLITYNAQQKGLEILLNMPGTLPDFIWTDAVRLRQILVNLLGNAAKFTHTGEIELKIEVIQRFDQGSIKISFSVRDTGIGIHPDNQHKIFEAFLQEDNSTTKKFGGTGLGLSISSKLLYMMGSLLELRSVEGAGSLFFFELEVKAEWGMKIPLAFKDNIKNILLVDDNQRNRIIIDAMLDNTAIVVQTAGSGDDAIALISSGKHFDLIMMDYAMPLMNGVDAIKKIKTIHIQPAPSFVLLCTAREEEELGNLDAALQISSLIKPVRIQSLYDVLSGKRQQETAGEELMQDVVQVSDTPVNQPVFKILMVEDNPFNMLLLSTMLERIVPGAALYKAADGKEAADICGEVMPDLIFMDVLMPVMNGYQSTAIIRKIFAEKHIPIVAITATNIKGEKEKCLDAGMDDFITKPIAEAEILLMIKKWLPGYTPVNKL